MRSRTRVNPKLYAGENEEGVNIRGAFTERIVITHRETGMYEKEAGEYVRIR